ncbi:hypothetical protein CEXT_724911 [Caerostris extrusa]|uniref:Uncharacterized protein n=1 Tax=Caerostris extrusa TaxID=172846 RepID=A0AAV4XPF4_CAEEX|nr:hypothetical protein CEXT_724911 [Caerostris extrusa]
MTYTPTSIVKIKSCDLPQSTASYKRNKTKQTAFEKLKKKRSSQKKETKSPHAPQRPKIISSDDVSPHYSHDATYQRFLSGLHPNPSLFAT